LKIWIISDWIPDGIDLEPRNGNDLSAGATDKRFDSFVLITSAFCLVADAGASLKSLLGALGRATPKASLPGSYCRFCVLPVSLKESIW